METTLPERSLPIKERLGRITQEILACAKDKIAMLILFGSYARGDWVQDVYREGGIIYSYQSDLDILLVLQKNKYRTIAQRVINDIQQRLKKKGLINYSTLTTPATLEGVREYIRELRVMLIAESIDEINKQLEKGCYFYSDIKREGITLYNNGNFQLAEAKELSWEERRDEAQRYYQNWFKRAQGFLKTTNFTLQENDLSQSAFLLHQATESFYNTILLVFSGYKPKLHDIAELGVRASIYSTELLAVFPLILPEQLIAFELLKSAYIEARYNDYYSITKEQLLYLIDRVEKLQNLTERICLDYIK